MDDRAANRAKASIENAEPTSPVIAQHEGSTSALLARKTRTWDYSPSEVRRPTLNDDGGIAPASPEPDSSESRRRYWAGKRDQSDPRRECYAVAPGSVTHRPRLAGGLLVRPPRLRPNRLRLIAAASGLMTESASGSSRSTQASTPGLALEHAAMFRRGAFSARWRNTGQRCVESEPRIPTWYSNSAMARQPARWRACPAKLILSTGRPPPSFAGRADRSPRRFPGSA